MKEVVLKGIPAASGIASGTAFILDKGEFVVPERIVLAQEVNSEIARFQEALGFARKEIHVLKEKIISDMGLNKAQIFDSHLLVLEDEPVSLGSARKLRRSYLWSKKVRLAVYKIITYLPKLISGNYKRKVTDANG